MSWTDELSDELRSRLKKQVQPEWTPPMLATLTHDPFSDVDWIYERKLDGQRLLAFRSGNEVRLMSRNRKPNTERYPEIAESLAKIRSDDFIVDGEIVAFESGVSSFAKLQPRMQINDAQKARRSGVKVYFYVFDLLHLDGYDVTDLPLRNRKALLRKALDFDDPIRFSPHRNAEGLKFLDGACRSGWEGLIAKRADSPYKHSRSPDWLKFKCSNEQEFVIGGYTDPQGARVGFGALLLGYYEDGELQYAGKVGTGYDDETLRRLHRKLSALKRKTPPFAGSDLPGKGVHWVTPRLVAQVGFTEWTGDGKLRHPRYLGLRDDKDPKDVVREDVRAVAS